MKNKTVFCVNENCRFTGKSQYEILLSEFSNYKNWTKTETNYTTKFKNLENNRAVLLADDFSSLKVFFAKNKIKTDYKKSGIHIDEIPTECINFFSINPAICKLKDIYLVDIDSAYPTALLNSELITKNTFDYLQNMKKTERLKSIGALATSKILKKYNYNTVLEIEKIPREPESVLYFYAAYKIGELLRQAQKIAGNFFHFAWFDGVYISDKNAAKDVSDLFLENNFSCKEINLNSFSCENSGNKNLKISWTEYGKEKKILTLPKR